MNPILEFMAVNFDEERTRCDVDEMHEFVKLIESVKKYVDRMFVQGYYVGFMAARKLPPIGLPDDVPPMTAAEQLRMREHLAICHQDGKCNVYGDDGEMQCGNIGRHGRTIDFRREKVSDLLDIILLTRARESYAMWTENDPSKSKRYCDRGAGV